MKMICGSFQQSLGRQRSPNSFFKLRKTKVVRDLGIFLVVCNEGRPKTRIPLTSL